MPKNADGSIGYGAIVEFATKRSRKQFAAEALPAVELHLAGHPALRRG